MGTLQGFDATRLNPFVGHQEGYEGEKLLYDNLINEFISTFGHRAYYLPRETVNIDYILNEDHASQFRDAYEIIFALDNPEGYESNQELYSKLGLEIRDEMTIVVGRTTFRKLVSNHSTELKRPREGDLVFLPFSRSLFEIVFVEHEEPFYQFKNAPIFKLRMSLFEQNNERFDVSIEGLDRLTDNEAEKTMLSRDYRVALTVTAAGAFVIGEDVVQTFSDASTLTAKIISINSDNTVIEVNDLRSSTSEYKMFSTSLQIVSQTSSLTRSLSSVDEIGPRRARNEYIDNETDTFVVSGTNPFVNINDEQ